MKVASILNSKGSRVWTTTPDSGLQEAAKEFIRLGIAALVVVDAKGIAGMLSEREIVAAFAKGEDLAKLRVGDVMRKDVYPLAPDDDVTRAMALMTRHRSRHLPVKFGDRLVGLISIGDAVKSRLDDLESETRVLRDISIAVR